MTDNISDALPYLRRYARALTGSQSIGDDIAAAALTDLMETSGAELRSGRMVGGKVALFQRFHATWQAQGSPFLPDDDGPVARAFGRLAGLTTNCREALLLHSVEGFTLSEVGGILGVSDEEADYLCNVARTELAQAGPGRIMIIEDEALIAMDLETLVSDLGHQVIGVAPTRADAIALAKTESPDLILADIQLADNSSGIDAVADIGGIHAEVPVIFITAFPERLLTGARDEPVFLIRKPYDVDQVKSSVAQAMFFASVEPLSEATSQA